MAISNKKDCSIANLQTNKKEGCKIIVLTAYDWLTASWLSECDVDFILVGDSLANVIAGEKNTLPVTMDEMIYHTKMVVKGAGNIPVIADMPFLSYELDPYEAAKNAGRFIKEAGADAVKIEGGMEVIPAVKKIVSAKIPIIGHIGLRPQTVLQLGGYKVHGKTKESAEIIKNDALALQEAGVFAIVIECVEKKAAFSISANLNVPTIGIGAGAGCDGQVLVTHDMLGWFDNSKKFVKPYANFRADAKKAVSSFISEVKTNVFPDDEHSF